eukprot:gnl/MRDRNA2_/MRDRNA2_63396_c0_seq1.p1 gnl/MRDRNA2_/MRDRNA2_63396_c0~~gnl/MRDRNA2_/MRDRNA2_63396_c0_seq1.p1  ORF type:complete len:181 (+),score=26.93 gnl/MRDRNA2_/MRDRNA2_63396_c0_seq1:111-653(+)
MAEDSDIQLATIQRNLQTRRIIEGQKYRPGQGLSNSATERLRVRRKEGEGEAALELPGKDESEQANMLLGNGAKKVARCGICTRPLDEAAVKAEKFKCSRCSPVKERGSRTAQQSFGGSRNQNPGRRKRSCSQDREKSGRRDSRTRKLSDSRSRNRGQRKRSRSRGRRKSDRKDSRDRRG